MEGLPRAQLQRASALAASALPLLYSPHLTCICRQPEGTTTVWTPSTTGMLHGKSGEGEKRTASSAAGHRSSSSAGHGRRGGAITSLPVIATSLHRECRMQSAIQRFSTTLPRAGGDRPALCPLHHLQTTLVSTCISASLLYYEPMAVAYTVLWPLS